MMGVWRWTKSTGGAASQGVRANAGSDVVDQTDADDVALSGSGSDGTAPYTYAWTVVSQPAGVTSASITSATSASATLTGISATVNGTYVCRLTVTDANSFVSTDRVSVDVQVAAGGGWTDIVNLDFTAASSQALTDGQENTIGSDVFWIDGLSGTGSIGITNGTGLQVSFPNQGGQFAVFLFKATGVSKINGDWPRFRVAASFSNITYSANSDGIGMWWSGYPYSGQQHVPQAKFQLKRNGATAYVFKANVRKGSLGTNGSSLSASDVATAEPTSCVMEMRQAAGGVIKYAADESTVTIPAAGSMTEVGSCIQPGSVITTSIYDYWAEGATNTGPYLGIMFRSNSNGSQACVVEQLIIQQFL